MANLLVFLVTVLVLIALSVCAMALATHRSPLSFVRAALGREPILLPRELCALGFHDHEMTWPEAGTLNWLFVCKCCGHTTTSIYAAGVHPTPNAGAQHGG